MALIQFGNDSLSSFKAERSVHRFQPLFPHLDVSLDLRYHRRQFFLAFLAGFGADIMGFALSVSISRTIPAPVGASFIIVTQPFPDLRHLGLQGPKPVGRGSTITLPLPLGISAPV